MKTSLHFSVGVDGQGDFCLYLQVLGPDSAHSRYATEQELEALAEQLTEHAESSATPEQFFELLDVCTLERVA